MNVAKLATVKKDYYPDVNVTEVTDVEQAKSDIASTASSTWGAGQAIGDTGWVQLSSPSPNHEGDQRTVFVCKASLLEGVDVRPAQSIEEIPVEHRRF